MNTFNDECGEDDTDISSDADGDDDHDGVDVGLGFERIRIPYSP